MTAPATIRVIAALTTGGADVRFVGGCVRDAVAGRPVKDVDIATPDRPEQVLKLLRRAGIRGIPTGISHGTVTAVADDRPFEITTLRRDVETDGRRAKVAFTDDWVADAARRDFTVNAMSCAPGGDVFDPFGGLDDLRAGLVRFVGDPRERIAEDVLRLLRFFRFQALIGRPPPHAESLAACTEMASRLPTLSGERVRAELLRLLETPDPAPVLRLMDEAGVLPHLVPEARRFDRLAALSRLDQDRPDPVRRLAAILDGGKAGVKALATRLRLSNAERDRLIRLVEHPQLGDDPPGFRRSLHRVGPELYEDFALLAAAEDGNAMLLARRLAARRDWRPRPLPIDGHDIQALGIPAGRKVGQLLARIEAWWIEEDFAADRDQCLERLRSLLSDREQA